MPLRAISPSLYLVPPSTNPPVSDPVVMLGWRPSPSPNAAGYLLCWGFASGGCTNQLDAGNVTNVTVGGLTANISFFFTVVAYSDTGDQADPSNEIQYSVTDPPGAPETTTGLVTSSINPALPGQAVSLTLSLSAVPPGVGTPTGTVQFKIDGTNAGAPVSLSGGGATFTTSTLAHGAHSVAAEYAGDGNFLGTTNSLSPDQVINTPPVAVVDTLERDPASGTKVSVAALLSNDSDPDGDPITFIAVSAASANGGTVVRSGGWVLYSPAAGFTNIDTFSYTISDGYVPVSGPVTVNLRADNVPSPNLTISDLGDGRRLILGDGIPARTYRIESADDSPPTNWQALGPALADPFGRFQLIDSNGSSPRSYRTVFP
jgi:hypothetical protein